MKRRNFFLPSFLNVAVCGVMALWLCGCLTAERKEYRFILNPDGSGTGTLVFYNLMSTEENQKNQSVQDYNELMTGLYNGKKFEEENPSYGNVRKRLYERDGILIGEITFDFLAYEDVGLYRHEGKGPWMYFPGTKSGIAIEQFDTSNGTFGGRMMPVIFWPDSITEFRIQSNLDQPDKSTHSLLPYYKRGGTE